MTIRIGKLKETTVSFDKINVLMDIIMKPTYVVYKINLEAILKSS